MKTTPSAASPDAYVAALTGWRRECLPPGSRKY